MAESAETILIMGANHRSSSLALRDQVHVDETAAPAFLHRLLAREEVAQAMILSTSERVEVVAVSTDPVAAARAIATTLAERTGLERDVLASQFYRLTGAEAVRHCFAVAAGLDSLVIGDPHVVSQLMEAHRIARIAGTSGETLDRLLITAEGVTQRVRTETGIAEGPVSIATVAVQLARHLHGDLSSRQVLLIGTGGMGGLIANSLRSAGVRQFIVTAPRVPQAETVAAALEGHLAPFTDLAAAMAVADIVVASISSRQYVIDVDRVRQALRRRRQRPIFIIDAGIPGDVEPDVNQLDNAFLYDLNDLERVAMEGRASRERAGRAGWDIIATEVTVFLKGWAEQAPVPLFKALQQHFEKTRLEVLREVGPDADQATRLLVTRLLQTPMDVLQRLAVRGDLTRHEREAAEQALRRLFLADDPARQPLNDGLGKERGGR